MNQESYRFGELSLNAGTQEVTRDGVAVPLPPLSFALLLTLVRNAPNVVTTQQLEAEVWSGLVIDRGTINKRVVLVRNALKQAGCTQDYISVVRGTGYRLAVPVTRIGAEDSGEPPSENTEAPPPAPPTPTGAGLRWTVFALLLLVLALVITGDRFSLGGSTPRAIDAGVNGAVPASIAEARSLGVLPFEQFSDDDNDRYFAEGISRELVRLLGDTSTLEVASSTSSFTFRDSALTPEAIAEQLGVDALLSGSVTRDGEQLVVMANLLHVPSQQTVWADRYEIYTDELFGIQAEIARRVTAALSAASAEGGIAATKRDNTASIEAYTLYLKGRSLLDERLTRGGVAVREGLESFRAAVRIDPAFVRAHVGIASASFLMPSYDKNSDQAEWLERAEASARFALDLDPASPEALGVLAAIVSWRGDPLQAAGLFERSMALGARDPDVLHWHAMLATSMGYFEALLPPLQDAYRLDPLNQLLGCSLAGSLNFSGRPDQALMVLQGMERFSRRDLAAAVASLYLGDWERARMLLSGIELRMGVLPAAYAQLLVEAFEFPPRRAAVEQRFIDGVQAEELLPLVAFEALLVMGSPRAFDLGAPLEGSYFEHRLPEAVWHNWGVELRRDPRFKGWVRALGYDQHWRKYGWPDRCRPTGLNDFECV